MKIINKHALSIVIACSALNFSSHNAFAQGQDTTLHSDTIIATWQPKHALIATFDDAEKALREIDAAAQSDIVEKLVAEL